MPSNAAACWLSRRGSNFESSAVGSIGFHRVGLNGDRYDALRERRLRQLFEQFAADAIEPPFFHDVEIEI